MIMNTEILNQRAIRKASEGFFHLAMKTAILIFLRFRMTKIEDISSGPGRRCIEFGPGNPTESDEQRDPESSPG